MSSIELRPWKTLSRQILLDHSEYLTVEVHKVRLPNGEVIDDWPWIIIPDAAIVLPQKRDGKYLCFRQTKYAVEGNSLAPVAGMVNSREDPLDTAKRELLEETGYQSDDWVELGSYSVDPNRGAGIVNLFLAKNVKYSRSPDSDDLEDQQLLELSREELVTALMSNQFKNLSWTACISMALMQEISKQ